MTAKLLIATTISLSFAFPAAAQGPGKRVATDEAGIRKSAYKTVKPSYPEASRNNKVHGVVVVQLEYDGRGDVTIVKVLEAPDEYISKAAEDAVWQWKFKRSTYRREPLIVMGKLTFYFSVDNQGRGVVSEPRKFTGK